MHTTASEIMSKEVMTIREGMTVEDALKLLINARITGMPVVNSKGKMIGVISDYDILQQLSDGKSLKPVSFRKPVKFSKKPEVVDEKTPLGEIVRLFIDLKYRRLPVTNASGKLVGIITRRDLMKLFYYRSKLR